MGALHEFSLVYRKECWTWIELKLCKPRKCVMKLLLHLLKVGKVNNVLGLEVYALLQRVYCRLAGIREVMGVPSFSLVRRG